MTKYSDIAVQNATWVAAVGARGDHGLAGYLPELSLMELLRVELDAPDLVELSFGELLNVRLDRGLIPFPQSSTLDPVRIASADLPDDLTELSLRDLLNLSVSLNRVEEEAPEVDYGTHDTAGSGSSPPDREGGAASQSSQGGSFIFEAFDLAVLLEDLPPEAESLFKLDELEDHQHGAGLRSANFDRLTPSDDYALPEAVPIDRLAIDPIENDPEESGATQPGEQDAQTGEQDDQPGEQDDQPGEQDDQPGEQDDQPGEQDDQPGEQTAKTIMGTNGDDSLIGSSGIDSLHGKDGMDYLDGGAGADDLRGGKDDDVLKWDADDRIIDGGLGNDTLLVQSEDLDLGAFAGRISSIERIDLAGDGGSNKVVLSVQDVLDISGSDMLTILGDDADSVDAGGGWTDGGVENGYHIYTQAVGPKLAVLHIDEYMSVNENILS